MERSINAPGSPSSALQHMYFTAHSSFAAASHLMPAGNPPPPRPLSPDFLIVSITSSGSISVRTMESASYPSKAMYSSMHSGLMRPQFLRAILFCLEKNSAWFCEISLSTGAPPLMWHSHISSISSGVTWVYI